MKKGTKMSEESRRKISLSMKGKSHKHTEKTKRKISLSRMAEKNWNWKGDNVTYYALHQWLRRNFKKPKRCQKCKKEKPLEIANVTGTYGKDRKNWKWLCKSCHSIADNLVSNLKNSWKNLPRDKSGRFTESKLRQSYTTSYIGG